MDDSIRIVQETLNDLIKRISIDEKRTGNKEKEKEEEDGRGRSRARKMHTIGIAAFLNRAREDVATVSSTEAKKEEVIDQPLNRKQRRALMNANREPAPVVEKEPAPVNVRVKRRLELVEPVVEPKAVYEERAAFGETNGRTGYSPVVDGNNYVKSCHFSPSGDWLSSSSQDRSLRIFRFDDKAVSLTACCRIPMGGLIYDSAWHPHDNLLASTSKDHPIHIWDTTGERQNTFRGINHLDELAAAYSLCFSLDGRRLYAGYEKCIRVFDMERPGRQTEEIRTWTKSDGGQKAIISSIAMNPTVAGIYSAACYGRSIASYSDQTRGAICFFSTDSDAVTHLEYSTDGTKLYGSARKNDSIVCWDLRNPGKVLSTLKRPGNTNQKIAFSIDGSGRYLFSGSTTGDLLVFDLQSPDSIIDPIQTMKASASALVGTSLHPHLPVAATSSGERVFPIPKFLDEDDVDDGPLPKRPCTDHQNNTIDNCIQLWKIGTKTSV